MIVDEQKPFLRGGHLFSNSGHLRRLYRQNDNRLLRRFPWRAEERAPILQVLGAAVVPDDIDVVALRHREGLSQRDFATIYGLPFDSLRSWERTGKPGGAKPTQAARAYLLMIQRHPHLVRRALGVAF